MTTLFLLASLACPAPGREPPRDRVMSADVYALAYEGDCNNEGLIDPAKFPWSIEYLVDCGGLFVLPPGTRLRVVGTGPPGERGLPPWVKVRVENGENWGREMFVREGVLEPRKWRHLDR